MERDSQWSSSILFKKKTNFFVGDCFILAIFASITEVHFADINELILVSNGEQPIGKVEDNREVESGLYGKTVFSENQVENFGRYCLILQEDQGGTDKKIC